MRSSLPMPFFRSYRCKMGGLKGILHRSGPSYVFEMLDADTEELFLHFDVRYNLNIAELTSKHYEFERLVYNGLHCKHTTLH